MMELLSCCLLPFTLEMDSLGSGWASIGGVCKSHNVALACHDDKADEVSMGRIMAHEIGHLLGM